MIYTLPYFPIYLTETPPPFYVLRSHVTCHLLSLDCCKINEFEELSVAIVMSVEGICII